MPLKRIDSIHDTSWFLRCVVFHILISLKLGCTFQLMVSYNCYWPLLHFLVSCNVYENQLCHRLEEIQYYDLLIWKSFDKTFSMNYFYSSYQSVHSPTKICFSGFIFNETSYHHSVVDINVSPVSVLVDYWGVIESSLCKQCFITNQLTKWVHSEYTSEEKLCLLVFQCFCFRSVHLINE